MGDEITRPMIDALVAFAGDHLIFVMLIGFVLGALLRLLMYYTVRSELGFITEFEKRAHRYIANCDDKDKINSFYQVLGHLFKKTYFEIYELKNKHKRRLLDPLTTITDRVFLIHEGVVRLIRDVLKQVKYVKRDEDGRKAPKFLELSKVAVNSNPVFNRVLGVFPVGLFNDLLNILPGLFVIGGIFGTFLGIMKALPELGTMDISDVEATKETMSIFLTKISFSMSTSIVGIILSVGMTILNTMFSPEGIFFNLINKLSSSIEFLWNETKNNEIGQKDYEGWINNIVNPAVRGEKLRTKKKEDRNAA